MFLKIIILCVFLERLECRPQYAGYCVVPCPATCPCPYPGPCLSPCSSSCPCTTNTCVYAEPPISKAEGPSEAANQRATSFLIVSREDKKAESVNPASSSAIGLPPGLKSGLSSGLPSALSGLPSSLPSGLSPSLSSLSSGLSSGIPSGLSSGLPSGLSSGLSGLPSGLSGLPSGLPSGLSGLSSGLSSGLTSGMSDTCPGAPDQKRSRLFTSLCSIPGAVMDSLLSGEVTV